MRKTVVALYDHVDDAQQAVRDLVDSGIPRDQVSLVASDQTGKYANTTTGESGAAQGAGVGAGIGAALGGIGGILVGLGALAIPGIGPVIAAGPLAAALGGVAGAGAGAIAGGATGGIVGSLTDVGVTEEQAGNFAEGVRRGGSLVTVMTDETLSSRAKDIMNRHHPIDVNERAAQWRSTGWTGFNPNENTSNVRYDERFGPGRSMDEDEMGNSGMGAASMTDMDNRPSGMTPQPTGSDYTGVSNRADMGPDTVMPGTAGGMPGNPGDQLTGSGYLGTDQTMGTSDFAMYDNDFRNHYSNYYGQGGYTYNDFLPAYQYGYDLANNQRYAHRDWNTVEPEARQTWEERHPGTWDQFKAAIQHAWDSVTNAGH